MVLFEISTHWSIPPGGIVSNVVAALSITVVVSDESLSIVNINPFVSVVASGSFTVCATVPVIR